MVFWILSGVTIVGNLMNISPPDITDDNELAGSVEYVLAVSGLSDREKEMLRLRFQSGKTYREIGCQYNISTVTVSDHINTSLRKLFRCSK